MTSSFRPWGRLSASNRNEYQEKFLGGGGGGGEGGRGITQKQFTSSRARGLEL
jgi:hypothetical protein